MRTDIPRTLFVLPHLDDEFAVCPLMVETIQANTNNCFVFYCAEELYNVNHPKRRREATRIMQTLGVSWTILFF